MFSWKHTAFTIRPLLKLKTLEELDYEIIHCDIGAEDYRTDCEEYDIYVLTGQRV